MRSSLITLIILFIILTLQVSASPIYVHEPQTALGKHLLSLTRDALSGCTTPCPLIYLDSDNPITPEQLDWIREQLLAGYIVVIDGTRGEGETHAISASLGGVGLNGHVIMIYKPGDAPGQYKQLLFAKTADQNTSADERVKQLALEVLASHNHWLRQPRPKTTYLRTSSQVWRPETSIHVELRQINLPCLVGNQLEAGLSAPVQWTGGLIDACDQNASLSLSYRVDLIRSVETSAAGTDDAKYLRITVDPASGGGAGWHLVDKPGHRHTWFQSWANRTTWFGPIADSYAVEINAHDSIMRLYHTIPNNMPMHSMIMAKSTIKVGILTRWAGRFPWMDTPSGNNEEGRLDNEQEQETFSGLSEELFSSPDIEADSYVDIEGSLSGADMVPEDFVDIDQPMPLPCMETYASDTTDAIELQPPPEEVLPAIHTEESENYIPLEQPPEINFSNSFTAPARPQDVAIPTGTITWENVLPTTPWENALPAIPEEGSDNSSSEESLSDSSSYSSEDASAPVRLQDFSMFKSVPDNGIHQHRHINHQTPYSPRRTALIPATSYMSTRSVTYQNHEYPVYNRSRSGVTDSARWLWTREFEQNSHTWRTRKTGELFRQDWFFSDGAFSPNAYSHFTPGFSATFKVPAVKNDVSILTFSSTVTPVAMGGHIHNRIFFQDFSTWDQKGRPSVITQTLSVDWGASAFSSMPVVSLVTLSENKRYNLCLNVTEGNRDDGSAVGVHHCRNWDRQLWQFDHYQRLHSLIADDRCLTADENGSVHITRCTHSSNQRWQWQHSRFLNQKHGYLLFDSVNKVITSRKPQHATVWLLDYSRQTPAEVLHIEQ